MTIDQNRAVQLSAWLAKLDANDSDKPLREKVLAMLSQRKLKLMAEEEQNLRLSAMFFQSLRQWPELPSLMLQPLQRLEKPLFSLALQDDLFSTAELHPAILFICKLCSAGYGIDHNDQRSPVAKKILQLSQQLCDIDNPGRDDFASMVLLLGTQLEPLEQRTQKIIQRMSDSEVGHALAQQAQRTLGETYNKIFSGKQLPAQLALAMEEHWCNSMRQICLQQGSASPEWTRGLRYAQFLSRIVSFRDDESKKQALYNTVDLVINNSHDVFVSLRRDPADLDILCESISECLMGMLRGEDVELQPMFDLSMEDSDEWIPDTLQGEVLAQVDDLKEGDWIDLLDDEGGSRYCRLAVRINQGQQFIFVNRQGMRVKDMSRLELAIGLQQQTVSILGGIETVQQYFEQQLQRLDNFAKLQRKRMAETQQRLEQEESDRQEQQQRERAAIMSQARADAKARALARLEEENRLLEERRQQEQQRKIREEAERQKGFHALAGGLHTGAWLEQIEGDSRIKLRLAVINRIDQKRIFVDRSGNKQFSLSEGELAERLSAGTLVVVETGADFSSTLATVVGGIRSEQLRRQ